MGLLNIFKKQEPDPVCCGAVVVAAGSSSRMGQNKLLLPLGGVPVLIHSLRALDETPSIGEVVLVSRPEDMTEFARLSREYGIQKLRRIVAGGKERIDSSTAGLDALEEAPEYVAIHDGARPLVTPELIGELVLAARRFGAAVPAVPLKDTVKLAQNSIVQETPKRDRLYAVQTPQVFRLDLIRAALRNAVDKKIAVTDDAEAAELLGMSVMLSAGDERNIKITTPVDLILAEALLAAKEEDS